jgi:hypothetical protein
LTRRIRNNNALAMRIETKIKLNENWYRCYCNASHSISINYFFIKNISIDTEMFAQFLKLKYSFVRCPELELFEIYWRRTFSIELGLRTLHHKFLCEYVSHTCQRIGSTHSMVCWHVFRRNARFERGCRKKRHGCN